MVDGERYPWLEGLNQPQREAAEHGGGPLLIVAGAGSGKTRTIVHRIAHLIRGRGLDPGSILAVTFTNKAAEEMRERVSRLLGGEGARVWVSTFHKFGAAVLRSHADRIGYQTSFVIYDEADQLSLLKAVIKDLGLEPKAFEPKVARALIEKLKREAIAEADFKNHPDPRVSIYHPIVAAYQERLKRSNAMDFSDLIYLVNRIFTERPEVLEQYHRRFEQILVDEYQDTNHLQYLLVRHLAAGGAEVCVVGDEDQSIYGWRGADISNILSFERDFPRARVVMLEQNYRSTQNIIEASSHLIGYNSQRKPKKLWTEQDEGRHLRLYAAEDDLHEARWMVEDILRRKSDGRALSDVAVFYRTHAQSRVLEDQLRAANLPYMIFGGTRFYDRKEIKDALAYLQFLVNPADEVAFMRIINVPLRGLGDKAQALVAETRGRVGGDWLEATKAVAASGGPGGARRKGFVEFIELIEALRGLVDGPAARLAEETVAQSGMRAKLEAEGTVEALTRLENLEELVNAVAQYERSAPDPSIRGFLEQVTLTAEIDSYDPASGAISLMTLHNAKGLEFPVVYIVGLVDGLLPHLRALVEEDETQRDKSLEEERRLCYVGMTRARELLTLTWARRRLVQGESRQVDRSMFLDEIPEHLLKREGPIAGLRRPTRKSEDERAGRDASRGPRRDDFGDSQFVYEDAGAGGSYEFEGGVTLKPGDKVQHPNYGVGVIQRFEEAGKNAKVVVRFGNGTKKFSARYAPLRPVE